MALSRVKTWSAAEILTAAALNAEFNNILNNPVSLIGAIDPTFGTLIVSDDAVFNEDGGDKNFRIETDNNINAFFVDGGLQTGEGIIGIGSTPTAGLGVLQIEPSAMTMTAATNFGLLRIANTNAITVPSGTTTIAAGVYIEALNLTATGTITNSASLYIEGVATEATNDYALWVDAGATQLDGNLNVGGYVNKSVTTSITAGTTQTQAGATALTTDINIVTVNGNDDDGVKLPTAVAGSEVTIINSDAAQRLQIWPNTSDTVDGGSANAVDSNKLSAGDERTYVADGATNWVTKTNTKLATPVTVANGGTGATSLTDGGVLLGSAANAVTAMAVLADGEFIVGNGSTDPVAESGATLRASMGLGTASAVEFDEITNLDGHPAFHVGIGTQITNISTGAEAIVDYDTEIFDQGSDFASSTFTAPRDGRYLLCAQLQLSSTVSAGASHQLRLITSNRYYGCQNDQNGLDEGQVSMYTINVIADMDASDTAACYFSQSSGGNTSDIDVQGTWFSGCLLA